jgi:hypothetical protein
LHLKEEEERAAFKTRECGVGVGNQPLLQTTLFLEKLKLWKNKIPGQKPLSPLIGTSSSV